MKIETQGQYKIKYFGSLSTVLKRQQPKATLLRWESHSPNSPICPYVRIRRGEREGGRKERRVKEREEQGRERKRGEEKREREGGGGREIGKMREGVGRKEEEVSLFLQPY